MLRRATLDDLDALLAIEHLCFQSDRISRRSFRHLLSKGHAATLVDDEQGVLRGYAMVLFHRGMSLARLYSIAVLPQFQGLGIGHCLVDGAEQAARDEGCVYLRLEVRRDNGASLELFRNHGYRQFGTVEDYYEDHMEALRFEKLLVPHLNPALAHVPYYEQTLEFTCGPAALLMAMKALDPAIELSRRLEIRLWRESTTVFMTSGHGGCGPYGLALAAYKRGFDVELFVNDAGALFVDSVRSAEKKEVMRIVQEDFLEELGRKPIPLHYRRISVAELREQFEEGGIPLVLISSYRIYQEKFPHWVVVTGFDERFIYVHDPFVDRDKGKSQTDCINMPILQKEFEQMARYGKSAQRLVVILKQRKEGEG